MILLRQNKNRHGWMLAIFVILQLFGFANHFYGDGNRSVEDFYNFGTILTFIACVMASQDVFNKLRNTASGIQYLMTPATILEKYAAAWTYSALFAFATTQATYFVVQVLGISLGNLLTGDGSAFGFPSLEQVQTVFLTVLYVHSIFFFGSILFRKNPIIKTIGSYLGILFLVTLIFAWYAKHFLFNAQLLESNSLNINMNGSLGSSINGMPVQHFLEMIGLNIKWILGGITVLLWSGSYLLLNKKQI